MNNSTVQVTKNKEIISLLKILVNNINKQKYLFVLIAPGLLYYLVFKYIPIYGIIIAFKEFDFRYGIIGSPWVGFDNFMRLIENPFFLRILKNTFLLSIYDLIWGFPLPIIFALLLNELKNQTFKKFIQTVSYIPHFISLVIMIGILKQILSPTSGIVNLLITILGGENINFFMNSNWFRTLYISSGIWQHFGWASIIYLASLASIDTSLYEAARIDGAGRLQCMWHITLPGIRPTIIVLFILRLGQLLNVGFEKVILMYNPGIYEKADIISTFVYRVGIAGAEFSFGAAVGLLNSVVALVLIISANYLSRKFSDTSLW